MRPRIAAGTRQRLDAVRDDDEPYDAVLSRLFSGGIDAGDIPAADAVDGNMSKTRPRLSDAVADRLRGAQRDDETLSETLERLLDCDSFDSLLLAELSGLADRLGRTPTARDVRDDDASPSLGDFQAAFGSWNAALVAAGFEPHHDHDGPYSDAQLIADLRAFADRLGYTPSSADMVADGPHSTATYIERFGGWNAALEAADLPVGESRPRISDDELEAAMREMAAALGEPPSKQAINDFDGTPSASTFDRRFGGLHAAIEAAGLETTWACGKCGTEFGDISYRNVHEDACDGEAEAEA